MKKALTLVLALVLLLTLFVSCKNDKNNEETTTAPNDNTQTEVDYLDTLPKLDLKNEEFNILITLQTENFYNQDEYTGDIVEDAAYERNLAVEDHFNTVINYVAKDGNASGSVEFNNAVRQSLQAGADAFDLVLGQSYYCLSLATEGMYHDLNSSDVLDFEQTWYHDEINKYGVVNGKLWGASGDFVISQIGWSMGIVYNKNVVRDQLYHFDYDLYDLVREGKWTYERFYELCTAFGEHQGNDNDMYAFHYSTHTLVALGIGFGVEFVTQNADGVWNADNFYNDHLETIYSAVYDLCYNYDPIWKAGSDPNKGPTQIDAQLFHIDYIQSLIANEVLTPFIERMGVLPMPKWNEAQEDYITYVHRQELFYIPSNVDFETSAVMAEALNQKTNELVVPEYFGKVFKLQSAQTSDDSDMLEIIRQTLHYDFAIYFTEATNYFYQSFANSLMNGKESMTEYWQSNKDLLIYQIGRINTEYGG